MYKIGELSKLCKIPVKTLRYYDSEDLLKPDYIDPVTGYRYYAASKLAECNKIMALKALGFTLEEIKKHSGIQNPKDILNLINAKEKELINSVKLIELQVRKLSVIKENIMEGEKNMFNIIIQSSEKIHVAEYRSIFHTKEDAIKELNNMKQSIPEINQGKRAILINYEIEYCENDFDMASCIEIDGDLPKDTDYSQKVI